MLRRWLNGLAPYLFNTSRWLIFFLALACLSSACSPHPPTPTRTHPERRVIIVGGGTSSDNASCTFYLDTARVYETLVRELHIPPHQITVLYSDGALTELGSDNDCLECNDPLANMEFSRLEKNWQACQSEVAQLTMQPPIIGDTRKETILQTVRQTIKYASDNSQVWIFRSGHGEIVVDAQGVHSQMRVMDEQTISDTEWGEILRTPTRASQVVLFLNQCHAFGFLDLPTTNPHLIVYTACGAQGADYAYLIYSAGPEWTWSKAWRAGLTRTITHTTSHFAADANQDGRVNLIELHQYILTHDLAAHDGIMPRHDSLDSERIYSAPGLAWGNEIDPTQITLIEE